MSQFEKTRPDVAADREELTEIVKQMAMAQNADQIMMHWAHDAVWFDITARFLKGFPTIHAEFKAQFDKLESCNAEIVEIGIWLSGDLGIVYTVQEFHAVTKAAGPDHHLTTRQTDCFERRSGEWKLVHQHISLPSFS